MTKDQKTVIEYYETSLKNGRCSVNYYYAPHGVAHKELIKQGIIKYVTYRGIFLGDEYKDHLFEVEAGSSDCEEILINRGKLQ